MTQRIPATAAPGPLEDFAQGFDELFAKRSQREGFRRYLEGLLLPLERNKTLTGLANAEPVLGAQHPQAQKLQWFVSESNWDDEWVNQRRLDLLREAAPTCPTDAGVLIIDETGDRKWGHKTAHVGRQYLSSLGKIDNGVVSVETVWADENVYYPVSLEPYTPSHWFAGGKRDPQFRTKPQIALELVQEAVAQQVPLRAVVADSFYGENEALKAGLFELGVGYVMALKPSHSWWHLEGTPGSLWELAQAALWQADQPGAWQSVERRFRDGHQETWWALEIEGGPYGTRKAERAIVVTTDPLNLPPESTWYLTTNLPAPGTARARHSSLLAADLSELVHLYGLRIWVEQTYKQVKQHLGWAQYQVRSDQAIRRHWQLVCCAFSFCWWALQHEALAFDPAQQPLPEIKPTSQANPEEKKPPAPTQLADGTAPRPRLARTLAHATAVLVRLVEQAPTRPASRAA
jgi:SRSO17 transposase